MQAKWHGESLDEVWKSGRHLCITQGRHRRWAVVTATAYLNKGQGRLLGEWVTWAKHWKMGRSFLSWHWNHHKNYVPQKLIYPNLSCPHCHTTTASPDCLIIWTLWYVSLIDKHLRRVSPGSWTLTGIKQKCLEFKLCVLFCLLSVYVGLCFPYNLK